MPTMPPSLDWGAGDANMRFDAGRPVVEDAHRSLFRARDLERERAVLVLSLPAPRAVLTGAGVYVAALRAAAREAASVVGPGLTAVDEVVDIEVRDVGRIALVHDDPGWPTLTEHLAEEGSLPEAAALRLLRRLCEPLRQLHARGVVHGCLTPDLVLVGPGGELSVLGAGLMGPVLGDLLRAGCMGAVRSELLAPEQRRYGKGDERADVYALGRILIAMVGEWCRPDEQTQVLIARCTAVRPQDRFARVVDLAAALDRVLAAAELPPEEPVPGLAAPVESTLAALPPVQPDRPVVRFDPDDHSGLAPWVLPLCLGIVVFVLTSTLLIANNLSGVDLGRRGPTFSATVR